jgi:hypothetical protein
VGYIDPVFASARGPRLSAVSATALLVASVLGAGAIGCGSSGDTTSAGTVGATIASPGQRDAAGNLVTGPSQATRQDAADAANGAGRRGRGDQASKGAAGEPGAPAQPLSSPADKSPDPERDGGPRDQRSIERVAAKHCPKGIDLAQCKALVEGSKQTQDSPSYVVAEPSDCVKAMGQAECEATYAAQKAAAESAGESVDVQECLRNPTPRCEAILRPVFEAAKEAEK